MRYSYGMKKSTQMNSKSEPATLHDLEIWGGNLAAQIASLETGQQGHANTLDQHTQILDQHTKQLNELKQISLDILEIVTSNESKLSPIPRHDDRIQNHEERIEKLEVKVRILQK